VAKLLRPISTAERKKKHEALLIIEEEIVNNKTMAREHFST
jgi:hypothetical protein